MPRSIPIQLLENIRKDATTLCTIIRIDPVQPGYDSYGAALLDQDVVYEGLTFHAIVGAQPSTLVSGSDLSVDGGQAENLLPEFDFPISEADIIAGAYDFARFTAYLVDYEDLSAGHVIIGRGTLGRFTVNNEGLSFTHEIRGLAQNLKQSITEKWSLGCRATFGSVAEPDSDGAGVVEMFPCKYPVEDLWIHGMVETVGLESNQSFTTSGLIPEFGGNPGMVLWLSGRNTGRTYEVDQFDESSSGDVEIGLTFPTMFPIQPGDQFRFRDDCPKTKAACKARDNWQNYRGEPHIPVGDAGQMGVPGASAGLGTGGRVSGGVSEDVE